MWCKYVSLKDWKNELSFAWDGINGTDIESVRGLSSHWHMHTIIFFSPSQTPLPNTPLLPSFHALLPSSPHSHPPSLPSLLPYNKVRRVLWCGGRTQEGKIQKEPSRQHPCKCRADVRLGSVAEAYIMGWTRPAHLLKSHTCLKLHACSAELYKRMRGTILSVTQHLDCLLFPQWCLIMHRQCEEFKCLTLNNLI